MMSNADLLPEPPANEAHDTGAVCPASRFQLTRDALVNGPTWFPDYGMHGLQWGATELFTEVREHLATAPPDTLIAISHLWANYTNALGTFFLDSGERRKVDWIIVDDVLRERRVEVNPANLFVLTPDEFAQAMQSPKLLVDPAYDVIRNPAGRPGFYLVHLAYTADADSIFAAEREDRRQLVDDTVVIDGIAAGVRHPKLDMGTIADAFDGNLRSLARTLDGNPTDLAISFAEARPVCGARLSLWTGHYNVDLRATRTGGEVTVVRAEHITGRPPETFEVLFDDLVADVVRLDLHIAKRGDVHIHMREIEILD